jgi:hypothetical protein
MNLYDTIAGWWLHTAVGGGLLLLVASVLMLLTRQPARRQRLGECGALAALLVALLCLAPAWLLVPVETRAPVVLVDERSAHPETGVEPEPAEWMDDTAVAALDAPGAAAVEPPAAMPQRDGVADNVDRRSAAGSAVPSLSLTTLCHWLAVAYLVVAGFCHRSH